MRDKNKIKNAVQKLFPKLMSAEHLQRVVITRSTAGGKSSQIRVVHELERMAKLAGITVSVIDYDVAQICIYKGTHFEMQQKMMGPAIKLPPMVGPTLTGRILARNPIFQSTPHTKITETDDFYKFCKAIYGKDKNP